MKRLWLLLGMIIFDSLLHFAELLGVYWDIFWWFWFPTREAYTIFWTIYWTIAAIILASALLKKRGASADA